MNKSNLLRAWRVMSWALIFFISVPVQIFTVGISPAQAVALPQINICHATSAEANPYTSQSVNMNATAGGHDDHDGGVFPEEDWGDIIPPYTYFVNEQTGENCETVIDVPDVSADGPTTYTKNSDFNDGNVNIDFSNNRKSITINPLNGYYIVKVELDVDDDNHGGYYDYTSNFSAIAGGTFNPNPGNEINKARVTIKRDAAPAVTHEECTPIYEDVEHQYPGKNWTTEGQAIWNNNCQIPEAESEPITILAWKIVCETEADLPDWGLTGSQAGEPAVITATTATDYVAASNGACWLEENWGFQYGVNGQLMSGDYVGSAPLANGWTDFSSLTGTSSPAQVEIEDWDNADKIWFREILQSGYIPFANPPLSNQEPVSAEFYCGNDILNFDNWEWIDNLASGQTHYCVAFNVPVGCGNGIIEGEEQCDDGPNGSQTCSPQCTIAPECNPEVELVINGGFEEPIVTNSNKWDIFPSTLTGWITDWMSLSPGTFGSQDRPEEAWLELHRKVSGWLPSEGEQYAELDGDWYGPSHSGNGEPASTKIKQALITWPGYNYEVSFDFSPRPSTGSSDNVLEFSWNGGLVATLSDAGGSNTSWSSHVYNLTATGFNTELMFADAGTSNSLGTFLDNVSVRCVPAVEPFCGDNNIDDGEACDDGNTENGDGCDAYCQIEPLLGQICGYKYNDKDKNGSWSEGDEGLADWTIELLQFTSCEQGDEWADSVMSYNKGNRRNGTPIDAERTDPAKALGVAQNNDTINFVALGFGGELVLAFNNLIVNGDGNDVQIFETTLSLSHFN